MPDFEKLPSRMDGLNGGLYPAITRCGFGQFLRVGLWALGFFWLTAAACRQSDQPGGEAAIEGPFHSFELHSFEGEPRRLEDFLGPATLVNFFFPT